MATGLMDMVKVEDEDEDVDVSDVPRRGPLLDHSFPRKVCHASITTTPGCICSCSSSCESDDEEEVVVVVDSVTSTRSGAKK